VFLESIKIIETSRCETDEGKFKAITQIITNEPPSSSPPKTRSVVVGSPVIGLSPTVLITTESPGMKELLPYLNAVLANPIYMESANCIKWKEGIIGITIIDDQVRVNRYLNQTELYETLDMVKDIVNDTYERKSEIEPDYTVRKIVPVLKIYMHLPKTNCGRCIAKTCMAFADQLNKFEVDIEDCPAIMEPENELLREKLAGLF